LPPAGTGPGRIEQRTFLGEKTNYQVRLSRITPQVSATDHYRKLPLDVGQMVSIRFHPEGIHVLD
jgi:hypothetical protein